MSTEMNSNSSPSARQNVGGSVVAGLALILIGLITFAGQYLQNKEIGLFFLPALGIIFLAWGALTRKRGLFVPGGILTGLGLSTYLVASPLSGIADANKGGIVLMGLALGFVLVTLFSAVFTRAAFWPLIPAAILGLVGGALLAGDAGLILLNWMGYGWPLILIGFGVYLLFKRQDLKNE